MRHVILTLILAASLSWAVDPKNLEALAEKASTPAEHVKVAKEYRLRAEQLDEKAQQHEEEARKLEKRPRTALEYKWPAMGRQPWVEERKLAMQAKRGANEARELADKHQALAVEGLAAGQ